MLFPKGREGFRQSPKGLCHQNNVRTYEPPPLLRPLEMPPPSLFRAYRW